MNHLTDSQLNEYLDHALDETTKRKFDSHLQACADCATRLDELKFLFTSLESLPEVKLRRDLSPTILARLSQKQPPLWTPFFAAQLGAVLGLFFWLSVQVTNFTTPIISTSHFLSFTMPNFQYAISNFQFPNLYSLFTISISLFSIPKFQLPTFSLPAFQPPILNLSTFNLIFISTSIFMLWLIGNLSLLRNRSGVQK